MLPEDAPGATDYRALAVRMGYGSLRARLKKQAGLWASDVHQGTGIFRVEAFISIDKLLTTLLSLAGLREVGLRHFLDLRIEKNDVVIPDLPAAFEGFRILQITDLHCDLHPPLVDAVVKVVAGLDYDLAVFTGDYVNKIAGAPEESLELMAKLIAHLQGPKFAILGNHDFIEKVAYLESLGLKVLLNESTSLRRGGDALWVTGIDDPHYFQTGDLVRARAVVPQGLRPILLSHSPEPYREAARLGFSLMLCGHTHGGQICLPGGVPVLSNMRGPRRLLKGPWHHQQLVGYTSRGTGGCGVPARFFCPPEITIHTLRSAKVASSPG